MPVTEDAETCVNIVILRSLMMPFCLASMSLCLSQGYYQQCRKYVAWVPSYAIVCEVRQGAFSTLPVNLPELAKLRDTDAVPRESQSPTVCFSPATSCPR